MKSLGPLHMGQIIGIQWGCGKFVAGNSGIAICMHFSKSPPLVRFRKVCHPVGQGGPQNVQFGGRDGEDKQMSTGSTLE